MILIKSQGVGEGYGKFIILAQVSFTNPTSSVVGVVRLSFFVAVVVNFFKFSSSPVKVLVLGQFWPILVCMTLATRAYKVVQDLELPPRGPKREQKPVKLGQTSKIFFSETRMARAEGPFFILKGRSCTPPMTFFYPKILDREHTKKK